MFIEMKVTAALANTRVGRSGENKGQVTHSVTIYGIAGDGVPAQFAIYGLPSLADSQEVARKYAAGSTIRGQVITNDPFFIDQDRLTVVQPAAK